MREDSNMNKENMKIDTSLDLIDRKEAIKVISNDSLDVKCFCVIGRGQENRELAKTINDYVDLLLETARRKILSLPKADTERHAHWIFLPNLSSQFDKKYMCSECKNIISVYDEKYLTKYPYCNCGCKMDEVKL